MSTDNRYMPILQCRQAEYVALKNLSESQKDMVFPVLEIKPEETGNIKPDDIKKIPEKVENSWGKEHLFYFDFSLLFSANNRRDVSTRILNQSKSIGLQCSVVINLADDSLLESIIGTDSISENGICLRIVPAETRDINGLDEKIQAFLDKYRIRRKNIDLLVDMKELNEKLYYVKIASTIDQVHNIQDFRGLFLAAGSFPIDLTQFQNDADNVIPRIEWLAWKQVIKNSMKKKPSFADYTIIHPIPQFGQFYAGSISIRYTYKDTWCIYRGKKAKYHEFGAGQYLAHAHSIAKSNRYYGIKFSYGDYYIHEKAEYMEAYLREWNSGKNLGKTGNATTWLSATINHHIAVVIDQLSSPI